MVAMTLCSWIAISNHCALRAIATKPNAIQSGCPFHSKPAKSQPQPAGMECCKILRAVAPISQKNLTPATVDLATIDFPIDGLIIFAPPEIPFLPATLDTGPPGKTSFVELIGSVRAHAPPFLA